MPVDKVFARINSTPDLGHSFFDEIAAYKVVAFFSSVSQLIVVV
jgi:hypothetical protein